ncbi:hypothetical protein J4418_02475 [Candidatus Woesearchaeota archaeon]|nr:hypothetical protein [Candidatus Woesearchaeota archaeon]
MLGFDKLQELVTQQKLIEKISEKELNKKGGVSFDLRIGEIHKFTGKGFLFIDETKTPSTHLLGKYEENNPAKVTLYPNEYYIVKTIEKVNLPKEIACIIISRTTLFRSGLLLLSGLVDPGYSGELTAGLINLTNKPFTLELGSRIANLISYTIEGNANPYISNYHGGLLGKDDTKKP